MTSFKQKNKNGKGNNRIVLAAAKPFVGDSKVKNRLEEVLSIQSSSHKTGRMVAFISFKLEEMGIPYYIDKGNIYATKGVAEFYPCTVSHTDTVHEIHKDYKIFEYEGSFYAFSKNKQVGTGGDDKVGIFICLEMLRNFPVMKAAFFRDEEVGCLGSQESDGEFFKDVGYAFQADRRGAKDITESINYMTMVTPEFKELIKPHVEFFKRVYVDGMMTDVEELASKYDVCMMNFSCGYYQPHSDKEFVVIQEVMDTYDFMAACIVTLGNKKHGCTHESSWKTNSQYGDARWFDRYDGLRDATSLKDEEAYWKGKLEQLRGNYYRGKVGFGDDEAGKTYSHKKEHQKDMQCPNCLGYHLEYDMYEVDYYCWTCGMYLTEIKHYFEDNKPFSL